MYVIIPKPKLLIFKKINIDRFSTKNQYPKTTVSTNKYQVSSARLSETIRDL